MRLNVVDSHTGGEPTRVVLSGQFEIPGVSVKERLAFLKCHHDEVRRGVVLEPRGSEVVVAAFLVEPDAEGHVGVIFCNNVGYLGMCGHGTIGVVETLKFLGKAPLSRIILDTPAGTVEATILANGEIGVDMIESYRFLAEVVVDVPGYGRIVGDVAYGGNWFFIVHESLLPLCMREVPRLTTFTLAIRSALEAAGITGEDGAEIDHVELSGASDRADSKNFVMCPGGAYDRSPCGTGTSAKLACLVGDGKHPLESDYHQESITGSVFRASARASTRGILPTIFGRAHITGETTLYFYDDDPHQWGIG